MSAVVSRRSLLETSLAALTDGQRDAKQEEWRAAKQARASAKREQEARVKSALHGEGRPLRIAIDCTYANRPENDREVRGTYRDFLFPFDPAKKLSLPRGTWVMNH